MKYTILYVREKHSSKSKKLDSHGIYILLRNSFDSKNSFKDCANVIIVSQGINRTSLYIFQRSSKTLILRVAL